MAGVTYAKLRRDSTCELGDAVSEARDFPVRGIAWTTPFCAGAMISGSAALSAARAAVLSPEAIASSTLRTEERMRERRAVLMWSARDHACAMRAEVYGIDVYPWARPRLRPPLSSVSKTEGAKPLAAVGQAYRGLAAGVNGP